MQGCKHELVLERSHEPQTGQLIQTLVFALRFDDDGMLHKEANAALQVTAELYNQHVAVGLAAWCMVVLALLIVVDPIHDSCSAATGSHGGRLCCSPLSCHASRVTALLKPKLPLEVTDHVHKLEEVAPLRRRRCGFDPVAHAPWLLQRELRRQPRRRSPEPQCGAGIETICAAWTTLSPT